MGKRSRKRSTTGAPPRRPAGPGSRAGRGDWTVDGPPAHRAAARRSTPRPDAAHARPVGRRAKLDEAPPAPWSPFPLVELCILAGLIMIVVALVAGGGSRIPLLGCGFALVAMSAIELAIREHFAGFRSHTSLLSGATAVAFIMIAYLVAGPHREIMLGVGAIAFALAFWVLRGAFQRRAGGLGFRA